MSVTDIFKQIEGRISENPERTKEEIDGVFKFVVDGDAWIVDCKEVGVRQADDDGDVTITVAGEDLVAISDGSMDPMQAFMMGKIVIDGDVGLAMKLQQVL